MGHLGRRPIARVVPPAALAGAVRRGMRGGLDLLFPPQCATCDAPLGDERGRPFCPRCLAELVQADGCPRCGSSAPPGQLGPDCPRCRGRRLHFDHVVRLGTYDGVLRTAVLRAKRPRHQALAAALGRLLCDMSGDGLRALRADVVVSVPMHWTRRLWRGTNSPDVVARQLSGHLELPLGRGLLARRRRTAPQAGVAPSRRRANVRGAFSAPRHRDLPGARVLLVDDIMTSGATVNEAAKTLLAAGAAGVDVAVLARAPGND